MFTFVISVVVVGVAIAFIAKVVLGEAPQPATARPSSHRGRRRRGGSHAAQVADIVPSPLVRLRSMVLLTVLLVALGLLLAVALVLSGAIVLTGLKNAVQG